MQNEMLSFLFSPVFMTFMIFLFVNLLQPFVYSSSLLLKSSPLLPP